MNIERQDKSVLFSDSRTILPGILAAAASVAALTMPGIAGWTGAGALALCAAASWRRDVTEFDGLAKTIRHSSRSFFRRTSQELTFRDIKAVFVESAPGAAGRRRVTLCGEAARLPLSWKFSAAAHDWEALADIVRRTLGLTTAESLARQSILNLLAQYPQVHARRAQHTRPPEPAMEPAAMPERLAA